MQDYKMELVIQAKDKAQALELKKILNQMYQEYGTEGLMELHKSASSTAGKMFTSRFKKVNQRTNR
jgi:hypothetical protein